MINNLRGMLNGFAGQLRFFFTMPGLRSEMIRSHTSFPTGSVQMATLLEGLKRLNHFYKPVCLNPNPAHISVTVYVGGVCEVWLKKAPQMNRQKKFCRVPPTFPNSCAILALLAVLLDCRSILRQNPSV